MYLNRDHIQQLEKLKRINLINSITGIKPALLVGTKNIKNISNLAIFSSIVHISSNPPLIGFFVRTNKKTRRDTLENIIENKSFTLNHIHTPVIKNSHYTSVKFHKTISEFKICGFTEQYIDGFLAPFVNESKVKLGLILKDIVAINSTDSQLVIGEIEHIFLKDKFLDKKYSLNLEKSDSISVGGLNDYYKLKRFVSFPYARFKDIGKIHLL